MFVLNERLLTRSTQLIFTLCSMWKTSNNILHTYHGILVISELVVAQSDIQNATHMTTKGTMGEKEETTETEREREHVAGRKGRAREEARKREKTEEGRLGGDDACAAATICMTLTMHDFTNPNKDDM